MKRSKKILNAQSSPQHKFVGGHLFDHKIEVNLPHHKSAMTLYFKVEKAEDDLLKEISYMFKKDSENKGMFDLYFQMIQGRAVESLDRVTTKEFDHFMRDASADPIFKYYDDQFYEIIGIGEEILRYLHPKKKIKRIFEGSKEYFLELSFSEQIEIFEELFVKHIYNHPRFHDLEIDIVDITKDKVMTEFPEKTSEHIVYLKEKIKQELDFELEIK